MTAQRSTGDILNYLRYRLTSLKGTLFIISILSFMAYPLLALGSGMLGAAVKMRFEGPSGDITVQEFNSRTTVYDLFGHVLFIIGVITSALLFIFAVYTAVKSFRYLIDRKMTDTAMSLPVSHDRRFSCGLAAGALVYIIPQLIAFGLMMIILAVSGPVIHVGYSYYSSEAEGIRQFLQEKAVFIVIGNAMMYFFSVMMISVCGRKLTAVTAPFLYTGLVTLILVFVTLTMRICAYGIPAQERSVWYGIAYGAELTPLGFILNTATSSGVSGGQYVITSIVCIAVYIAASYFLVKHRRAERTGSAFVYKGARWLTQFTVILSFVAPAVMRHYSENGGEPFAYSMLTYYFMRMPIEMLSFVIIVFSAAVYFIIEKISRERLKDPRRLGSSVFRFICSWVLASVVCFCFSQSGWLLGVDRVPEISEVENVMYSDNYITWVAGIGQGSVTSAEDIQRIESFHRTILERRPDFRRTSQRYSSWADNGCSIVGIVYNLKNGEVLEREYYLPEEYSAAAAEIVFSTDVFASQYELPANHGEKNYGIYYYSYDRTTDIGSSVRTDIPIDEFIEAIKHDARNTSYDDVFRRPYRSEWVSAESDDGYNNYVSSYCIFSFFTETRRLLDKYGVDLFGEESADRYFITKVMSRGNRTRGIISGTAEHRELTPEQAAELYPSCTADYTAYDEARDVYIIRPAVEYANANSSALSISRDCYVTEDMCDRAAEIFENAAPVSEELLADNPYLLELG